MAIDFKEIRQSLVTAMEQVPGLNAYGYVQDRFEIPCAYVNRISGQYNQTFDPGSTDEELTVTLLICGAGSRPQCLWLRSGQV